MGSNSQHFGILYMRTDGLRCLLLIVVELKIIIMHNVVVWQEHYGTGMTESEKKKEEEKYEAIVSSSRDNAYLGVFLQKAFKPESIRYRANIIVFSKFHPSENELYRCPKSSGDNRM